MAPQKTASENDEVNNILRNLRGEHFRHARNLEGKPVSSSSLSSHAHNRPTLPINLIYPSSAPAPAASPSWVPGPSPPRSWQSPAASTSAVQAKNDIDTPAWREHALSPLFSADPTPSWSARSRPVPQLTLLCLHLIRATCRGTHLAQVVPYIPLHLRRTLLRHTAIHAPLSQIGLTALCQGTIHVDTELVVVGPRNTIRPNFFRKNERTSDVNVDVSTLECGDCEPIHNEPWDAVQTRDSELLALRSLAVLSSSLNAAIVLAFPPTITHLALIRIPHRIPLQRLPMICPLLVFLDVSYNTWLSSSDAVDGKRPILEEVGWGKLPRLKVLGLRACSVSPMLLMELNRGRWEDVGIIQ